MKRFKSVQIYTYSFNGKTVAFITIKLLIFFKKNKLVLFNFSDRNNISKISEKQIFTDNTLKKRLFKKSNKTVKVFINLSFVYLLSIFVKQCFII